MLGLSDPKRRIGAIIEGMKDKMPDSDEHDYSALMIEPVEMLLEALEAKDAEGISNMLIKLHNIMHGKNQ